MHLGLWSLSWLPKIGVIKDLSIFAKTFKYISETKLFYEWVGSNTGGMYVEFEGINNNNHQIKSTWRLYAGSGEGV